MANKDGIVSIGFDYKKELEEVCATIERELNNLGGDINLSDSMKKQMAEMKKMIADMKQDIGSSFDKLSTTKLDTKAFESFKKDVNKKIKEVSKEVDTLKEQFSVLDSSSAVNGVVEQFANLKKYVEESNRSISEFIGNTEKIGNTATITPTLNTGVLKSEIEEIKDLLSRLGKEDFDFGYSTKSAKELGVAARDLVFDYRDISEEIDDVRDKLKSMNSSDIGFKEQQAHLSKLSLELVECGRKIDDVFGATNSPSIDWEKYLDIDEVEEISKYIAKKTEEIRANAQKIVNSVSLSEKDSNVKSDAGNYVSRNNNVELHISTKQSTINKQLDEMIDNLQQRAASKPIIAPVKLRVDSEYEKTTKDASASALTENQINEARKDIESVVPGLEKAFNNSMRIATNKAVENAKESIKAVREFFESNPITVHLTVPEDERLKIGKAILSEDGKTTVDISGQVDRARKSVKGLSEDLEKSQLLIKENAQNAKNLSLDKLVDSLSETVSQFSEIKTVISSIQNIDDGSIQKLSVNLDGVISKFDELISTVKTATNALYSIIKQGNVSELDKQWSSISNKFKSIADESGKINLSKQKTDIKELMDMYQKYESVGGTNSLMSLTDNVETIRKLDKEYQKLNQTQTVDNSSTIEKESEAFAKVEKSVDSLTTAIGDIKVQAINIEATAMEDAAEREIVAIKAILDNLDLVINRLNDIKDIKLPKIEVDNIDVVENAVKSFGSVGNKSNILSGTESSSTSIKEESQALEQVSNSAKEAANSKEKFVNANKEVKTSADSSNTSLNEEKKKIKDVGDSADTTKKQLESMQSNIKKYQDKVSDMSLKPDASHRFPEYQAQLDKINSAITDYETHVNYLKGKGVVDKSDIDKANELEDKIKSLLNETKKFSSGDKGFTALGADKTLEKINSILQQNSAMSRQAKQQIKAYYNEILNGNPTRPLNEILDSVYKIVQAERLAGRDGKSFLDTIKDKAWYGWAAQLTGMFGIYDVINVFRQGATAVKEFEDGLTKISYTMDMTKSQLDDLGESVLGLASDMKSSVDDAMNVAQIYANMQTSAEEIQKLSEPTLILSNLSGFDSSTIADDIQAVTQQFDMLAEDSMHIADVYDYISRNIAVDYSKGLNSMAEGLQVAGSTAKQAGLDFEQTASIIAKAVEKTRLEGSQVGNGLKTILTRTSKVGKLSDEVDNETLSQASESLKKIGIEVYNLDGTYRQFDVIMTELANKWADLSDAEKSNISFSLAATRQTNLLSAILSNFSDSMQLAEEATNANGSALENQQKYMESFSGSLQSLETEAKIAWINILDSDTLKSGIDLLTGLVKVIGELVDKFGLLGTAGIGLSAGLAFKNVGVA